MSDKPLTVEIPEELLTQVESAQLDVRQIMIEAFNREINRLHLISSHGSTLLARYPSDEAIEQAIQDSLNRVASGVAGLRTLGLNAGSMWMSDDFDDELPDEFWFGDEP
jgi:hypothetical protein